MKDYLCRYTQAFTLQHIPAGLRRKVWVQKARFNYQTESWERAQYELPYIDGDFVLLTPKDILTRDENWINRTDMIRDFERIPVSMPDAALRGQVFNYFEQVLVRHKHREPSQKEHDYAAARTLMRFPQLIDHYIRLKEESGDRARAVSSEKVIQTERIFDDSVRRLQAQLAAETGFYTVAGDTYEEAHQRLAYMKDVIENKGGHRIFYQNGVAIQRESDLQILCRFVWFGSPSDVGTEANDGRGPVDYKISRGRDKTLIEMKLAKNTGLKRNLEKQLPIYQAASDAEHGIKVIIYFSLAEKQKVDDVLGELKLVGDKDVVLIDARNDNKPAGSKA